MTLYFLGCIKKMEKRGEKSFNFAGFKKRVERLILLASSVWWTIAPGMSLRYNINLLFVPCGDRDDTPG